MAATLMQAVTKDAALKCRSDGLLPAQHQVAAFQFIQGLLRVGDLEGSFGPRCWLLEAD
jgi:hypothetical protein